MGDVTLAYKDAERIGWAVAMALGMADALCPNMVGVLERAQETLEAAIREARWLAVVR